MFLKFVVFLSAFCFCFSYFVLPLQSFDMEEQLALKLWNEKWAVQVAPFIAQCEQVTFSQQLHNRKVEKDCKKNILFGLFCLDRFLFLINHVPKTYDSSTFSC